ncbi:MAG: type II secretion system F family protein [Hyphomicrobiales bacterium]
MYFGDDITELAIYAMIAVSVAGVVLALLYPMFSSGTVSRRVKAIAENSRVAAPPRASWKSRLFEDAKESKRKVVQESLKQIEEREKQRKKRRTLRTQIMQSGLEMQVKVFWLISAGCAVVVLGAALIGGVPWYVSLVAAAVGGLGLPRWFLRFLRRRRQNMFLNDFADAIDVMVRGLKSGLPVSDAMKIIAAESGAPVGPEFSEVVEGQRIGITIDQGIERMYERLPLAEVNFLAIVMTIQQKTGGNLSETLGNLSKVLRDRKRMKAKIRAVSQEAKSSAAIIGALPFVIMGALTVLNPTYLNPMFYTNVGNMMLIGSGLWMLTGVIVIRKMINFQI